MKQQQQFFWYFFLGMLVVVIGVVYSVEQKKIKIQETQSTQQTKIISDNLTATSSANKVLTTSLEISKPTSITVSITAKKSTEVSSGVFVTDMGDDLLVLINKTIRLPASYEPTDLVSIDGFVQTTKGGMVLRVEAAQALEKLDKDAKRSGVNIVILSAYRSYWSQQATFSLWVNSTGLAAAETFSARPGHSQHQLGTAFDYTSESITLGITKDLTKTAEGKWMEENAHKYGFVISYPKGAEAITGYIYEPWHWRYIGVENVKKFIDSGLILEQYLKKFGVV